MPRRVAAPVGALTLVAFVSLVSLACSRSEEGVQRALVRYWPGADEVVRTRGLEVFHEGRWVAHGEVVYFFRSGEEQARGFLHHGRESGHWRERYEDGTRGEGPYVDGRRHGTWTYSWPDGAPQERGDYADGKREGRWTSWYPDGVTLRSEVTWKAGEKTGPAEYRHRDGTRNAQLSGTYENGVKVD